MIWVIFFFIIILISSVLAYRSMRDYEEFPDSVSLNALFYIGNPSNINEETLKRIHSRFTQEKHFFSLERLVKGDEKAVVLFGERQMREQFPELSLVEIEDYVGEVNLLAGDGNDKTVDVNQAISWLIEPKSDPKKLLTIGDEFRDLKVGKDQKVFVQVILMPSERAGETVFQATIRVMVADPDPVSRVALAKSTNDLVMRATGLKKHDDNFPEGKKFESFKQRSFIPKEVSEFTLTTQEVLDILS